MPEELRLGLIVFAIVVGVVGGICYLWIGVQVAQGLLKAMSEKRRRPWNPTGSADDLGAEYIGIVLSVFLWPMLLAGALFDSFMESMFGAKGQQRLPGESDPNT